MARPLTDRPFDEYADADDLHLVQALRRTRALLDDVGDDAPEGTDRLRDNVRLLLSDLGDDEEAVGFTERVGSAHDRLAHLDPAAIDRARAALMAWHDDPSRAPAAADAVAEVGRLHRDD